MQKMLIALVLLITTGCQDSPDNRQVLEFWAMGAEGELVLPLIADFEKQHPEIDVRVQQIPWNAAHEKLLTAFAGDATPDICQLGNTWIPEFTALGALEELDPWIQKSDQLKGDDFFPGVWQTNLVDEKVQGIPWYVDTRLLFYRKDILAQAGFTDPPQTWNQWLVALRSIQAQAAPGQHAILLPTNEFEQPLILGLQTDAAMLRDAGRFGSFSAPEFRKSASFYLQLFEEGLAPNVTNTQISNLWQEFEKGSFAMYISGPWNVGELNRRLAPENQDIWATAPLPAPAGAGPGVSNAGGCSLVLFRDSQAKSAGWQLIEFLSQPVQQVRFFELLGNLPSNREAWRHATLSTHEHFKAFHQQLEHTKPMPGVPEWEAIAWQVSSSLEESINGQLSLDQALASLDYKVDRILTKRRWMIDRRLSTPDLQ